MNLKLILTVTALCFSMATFAQSKVPRGRATVGKPGGGGKTATTGKTGSTSKPVTAGRPGSVGKPGTLDSSGLKCDAAKKKLLEATKYFLVTSGKNATFFTKTCKPLLSKTDALQKKLDDLKNKRVAAIAAATASLGAAAPAVISIDQKIAATQNDYDVTSKSYKNCKSQASELKRLTDLATTSMKTADAAKKRLCGK